MRCALLPLQQPQQGFWHLRSMHCMVARGAAVCGVDGCYPGTIAHELTTAAVLCLLVWLTAFVFRSWVYLGYALQQPAPQALPDATRTRWRSRWSSDSRSVCFTGVHTPGPVDPAASQGHSADATSTPSTSYKAGRACTLHLYPCLWHKLYLIPQAGQRARVAHGPIFVFRTSQLFHSIRIGHT
jgi:hypothetical protein